MKLTKDEFDKKYAINELSNIEIFDTIFYLFDRESELENRSCEGCQYRFSDDLSDISNYCCKCSRYYTDLHTTKE